MALGDSKRFLEEEVKEDNKFINFKITYSDVDLLKELCGGRNNPIILYLKMRTKIIRKNWQDSDDYPLKKKFYDKGYLVMSMSQRKMAKEFGMNKDTVHEYINRLHFMGWLKAEKLNVKDSWGGQYVYILGTWREDDGKIIEDFYCHDQNNTGLAKKLMALGEI